MIRTGSKEITGIYAGSRVISAVYHGASMVWQALENVWRGLAAWRGKEPW